MTEAAVRVGLAAGVGLIFGWGAFRTRALTFSGAMVGGLFAASLVLLGDPAWIAPGFVFFVLSSALSRIGRSRKGRAVAMEDAGFPRDAAQVLANGGPAWLALLLNVLQPSDVWLVAYLGALAAAGADTWATEIGLLTPTRPRLITTRRRVPPGTSGAVSGLGVAAAVAGAAVVWLAAWPWVPARMTPMAGLIVTGSGVAASFLDSLLGATVQGGWFGNDAVNLVASTAGAVLAVTCFRLAVFAT